MTNPAKSIEHLSYSSISTYLMCGRCWKFRYLDRIPAPTSPALAFGGAFHNTVEAYVKNIALEGKSAALLEIWQREWNAKLTQVAEKLAWGGDTPDGLFEQGTHIFGLPEVVQFVDEIIPLLKSDGTAHIEDRVEMQVPGVPVPIIGYIDIIADDGIPGDFKTSSKSWSERQAQSELQPVFYLAALGQLGYDGNPEMCFRHYVFVKTKKPKVQVVETRRDAAEIPFLFELIREVWRGIDAGIFIPNPTTWKCSQKYCEYWEVCRQELRG